MKITVNTLGTRGDIQPYIALSLGLQQAGHSVCILTHQIFETFVKEQGLEVYPLQLDPRQVLVNQALSELGNNTIRINRWMEENFKASLQYLFIETLNANRGADFMLNSGLSFAGWHVAEKLNIPAIATYLWPVTPSRHFPAATGKIPPKWLPFRGVVNYLSIKLFNQLFFNLLLPSVNRCREDILDLQPLTRRVYWSLDSPASPTPLIYGYSPAVVPRPPDWSGNQHISGYWFLDTAKDYRLEKTILDFLANGPPPVYVGFGSMVDHERDKITQVVINALRETNQRGILLGGWSGLGLGDLPDFIYQMDAVPHDWLFPQMAAVVHHGGAGTTAAGLRAGVPNVIVPSFGDQFFWGWRVHEIGAGPKPIPRNSLTVTSLSNAIQQAIDNADIKNKASLISQQIRAENGVENAVSMINGFMRNGHL
jgi:UDP:flavonoid glycosyltransferase YjiC (YdhE family)